jgi:hypothetical protein
MAGLVSACENTIDADPPGLERAVHSAAPEPDREKHQTEPADRSIEGAFVQLEALTARYARFDVSVPAGARCLRKRQDEGDRSVASTVPAGPTRFAMSASDRLAPAATSSTRAPGDRAISSMASVALRSRARPRQYDCSSRAPPVPIGARGCFECFKSVRLRFPLPLSPSRKVVRRTYTPRSARVSRGIARRGRASA